MTAPPPHHTRRGFRNIWPETNQVRRRDILNWMWHRRKSDHPRFRKCVGTLPVLQPDLDLIHRPPADRLAITWLGHATCLVQFGGVNLLTDPIFSQRCSPVQFTGPHRITAAPLAMRDLPPLDFVAISHNHYDHLDRATARFLGNSVCWLVPLGLKRWFTKLNIANCVELDWWDQTGLEGAGKAVCLPARHFSSRTPWNRNQSLWAGWLFEMGGRRVYFAGDTGYEQHFSQIRDQLGAPDLALLPIGAYRPEWFMLTMHLNPAQAVRAHLDLGAKQSLGIHWGTFILSDEPPAEPPRLFLEAAREHGLAGDEAFVMQAGETRILD